VIQKLPPKIFLDGDNAYICTETLLTPFSGVEKEDPAKDAFNFYLSQLRIPNEQTFGLMTAKWRILHQQLQTHLDKIGKIFMCISRLHNFCIYEGTEGYVVGTNGEVDQCAENEAISLPVDGSGISESSMLRDIIVNDLVQHGLQRPTFS